MSVQWNLFDFTEYDEKEGFLYSEIIRDAEVVVPGGKTIKVKEGDILVVDKAGKKVEVLVEKKAIEKVIENVKTSIKKQKKKIVKANPPILKEKDFDDFSKEAPVEYGGKA